MVWDAPFALGDGQVACREGLALLEPQRSFGPLCALPVQRLGNAARPSRFAGFQDAHCRFRSGMAAGDAQPRPDRSRASDLKSRAAPLLCGAIVPGAEGELGVVVGATPVPDGPGSPQ